LSLLKCGLTAPKIAEIGNFGYKFAQKEYTRLSDFFTKFSLVGESQVRTVIPNFTVMALKMWASRKNREKSQFLV